MFAGTGVKFAAIFLMTLALILSGLTRCGVADDREIIDNDAGANLALPGEPLENGNDDGSIITSASFFQPCPFYHSCFALSSNQPLLAERTSSKDILRVHKRPLLI